VDDFTPRILCTQKQRHFPIKANYILQSSSSFYTCCVVYWTSQKASNSICTLSAEHSP